MLRPPIDRPLVVCCYLAKGGSGKTTTSIHLAAALHDAGYAVKILDADPQAGASGWARDAALDDGPLPFQVAGAARNSLHREPALYHGHDVVIIDCPPASPDDGHDTRKGDVQIVRSALRASEIVLMPARPTLADTRRIPGTHTVVDDLLDHYDGLTLLPLVLLNQADGRTNAATEVRALLDSFDDPDMGHDAYSYIVLDAVVPHLKSFAFAEGAPLSGKNTDFFRPVAAEILELAARNRETVPADPSGLLTRSL